MKDTKNREAGQTLATSGLLGREFYLMRFYWRGDGFWLAICEIVNHDNGKTWALLQGGWNKQDGGEIAVSS